MNRPWHIWSAFGACATLAVLAAGWVSIKALQTDANEITAREKSILEENTRLALWRMDSLMAPLVAQENARPYFAYDAFYPADRAYGRMFNTLANGEPHILVPSPLLGSSTPYVLVHFQIDPHGVVSSPQIPKGKTRPSADDVARSKSVTDAERHLDALRPMLVKACAAANLPAPQAASGLVVMLPPVQTIQPDPAGDLESIQKGQVLNDAQQFARNRSEYQARSLYVQRQNVFGNDNSNPIAQQVGTADGDLLEMPVGTDHAGMAGPEVQVAMMKAFWAGQQLLLARRVTIGDREYVQGCYLDWPAIRASLIAGIVDLLPHAHLLPHEGPPSENSEEARDSRLLASLPVRLAPGDLPLAAPRGLTPVQLALVVGWVAVAIAAGAVAMLLQGVLSLSERRAAFVSAVTHELRTPLTTFRMYSEMLSQGMVREESDRKHYLDTLRAEAERLTHLVANVLAYARLERGRPSGRIETMSVDRLLDVATERLPDRAAQGGFTVAIDVPQDVGGAHVRADAAIVEQILFNLVDNACKYAALATDKTLTLSAALDATGVVLRVCDHGPGIPPRGQKLLFQPFRKSASEAAVTAPGVGLGLALSRRLARDMGGDLRYEPGPRGTCFAVWLQRTRETRGFSDRARSTVPVVSSLDRVALRQDDIVTRFVCLFMGLASLGCAHHKSNQSAYAPPLAPPVYPQPQMATQPVVYPAAPVAAPVAPVMAAPVYAPPAGAVVAPANPPAMASSGVVPAMADGSCPPCEGSGAMPVVYEGAMQTPPCPPGQ